MSSRPALAVPFTLLLPLAAQATAPQRLFDAPVLLDGLAEQMDWMGDLDNDGDVDVLAFLYVGNTVLKTSLRPLVNDGAGNLTPGTAMPIAANAGHQTALADVDGDGFRDVLVTTAAAHPAGTGVLVYRGLGAALFAAPVHVPVPGAIGELGTGNANNDGVTDVFVMHGAAGGPQARWLLGGPGLTFPAGPSAALTGMVVPGGALLDADGDGITDFAALTAAGIGINAALFRTTPAGLVPYLTLPFSPTSANTVVAADLDGDGDDDLLGVSPGGTSAFTFVTLHNQGAAGFTSSTQVVSGSPVYGLTVVDWDGDGDRDAMVRGNLGNGSTSYHTLTLYANAGGLFTAARTDTIPMPVGATGNLGAGAADLDNDGAPDFADSRALLFGTGSTQRAAQPYTATPDDWDGDGDLDNVMRLELLVHDGGGGFTELAGFWPPQPGPNQYHGDPVATGDFDGDGHREMLVPLVLQTGPASSTFLGMRRLEANGDGRLVDVGAAAAAGAQITGTGVADDADSDGDVDVVNGQGVWQNDGTGTFTLLPQAFQNWRPVQKGDVDGDGDQDLLAVVPGLPSCAVLHRTAPATYALTVLIPTSTNVVVGSQARFADLDDDGDLDVVARQSETTYTYRVATFLNTVGTFAPGPTIALAGTVGAGDFDGDARTDLFVQEAERLHLLLRLGAGLVWTPTTFALRGATTAGDLDQDGDFDLLGVDTAWNRRFEVPAAGHRRQYGSGSAGTGGRRPLLSMVGPLRAGLTASTRVVAGFGGSFGVLLVSTTEANVPAVLPGVTAYVGPIVATLGASLGGASGQPGAGAVDLPIAIPLGANGAQLFLQFVVLDPAAPIGLTHSNGCEMFVGL